MKSSSTLRFIMSHYGRLIFSPEDIGNSIKQSESIPAGQSVELQPERPDNIRGMTARRKCFFNKGLKILLKQLRDWFVHQGLWNMIILSQQTAVPGSTCCFAQEVCGVDK